MHEKSDRYFFNNVSFVTIPNSDVQCSHNVLRTQVDVQTTCGGCQNAVLRGSFSRPIWHTLSKFDNTIYQYRLVWYDIQHNRAVSPRHQCLGETELSDVGDQMRPKQHLASRVKNIRLQLFVAVWVIYYCSITCTVTDFGNRDACGWGGILREACGNRSAIWEYSLVYSYVRCFVKWRRRKRSTVYRKRYFWTEKGNHCPFPIAPLVALRELL